MEIMVERNAVAQPNNFEFSIETIEDEILNGEYEVGAEEEFDAQIALEQESNLCTARTNPDILAEVEAFESDGDEQLVIPEEADF